MIRARFTGGGPLDGKTVNLHAAMDRFTMMRMRRESVGDARGDYVRADEKDEHVFVYVWERRTPRIISA